MRISTNQLFQTGVSAMQRSQIDLNHTSLQLATGRRILTPADDPGGATQVMRLEASIKATRQFQRNVDIAQPRLEQEEAQLNAAENILQRARELVVAASSDTYNATNRATIASEIRQLRDDLYAIANSQDANGEYLFAGTRSETQPFVKSTTGMVSYVGAEGAGSVRELEISATRRVAVGDTGAAVFMEIPERSGLVTEAVIPTTNTGDLDVIQVEIADLDEALASAGETFRVRFTYPDADPGTVTYSVLDADGNAIQDADGNLVGGNYGTTDASGVYSYPVPREPIEFAGRRLVISGPPTAPGDGDEIISRPVKQLSIFETLDAIAIAFESDAAGTAGSEQLAIASSQALRNLDSGLDNIRDVRASVGIRLQTIDNQTSLNDERLLNLETTVSEIRDLDYAEAISRFSLQQTALQAAQQTYVQVNRLSLFNFLS